VPLPQPAIETDVFCPLSAVHHFRNDQVCAREGAPSAITHWQCALQAGSRQRSGSTLTAPHRLREPQYMRYLARLNAEPAAWLLVLMVGSVMGTLFYIVLTSITF